MRKHPNLATARRYKGFTLIELMIAVAVATILTVIAVPSYINTVRKSHRTEAKSILLDIAGREERYLATNGVYTTDATQLGFSANFPQSVGSGYYQIDAPTVSAATVSSSTLAATPPGYSFVAEAINGQTKDTQCAQFTINQSGVQGSLNSGGAASTGCW
jgi:type IV pilus assembly protein PilE